MKRSSLFLYAALLLPVSWSAAADKADDRRLNILFVFADDWGRYASCYRGLDGRPTLNDVIHTPHVDRVARGGVLFRHAFVNAPSGTTNSPSADAPRRSSTTCAATLTK